MIKARSTGTAKANQRNLVWHELTIGCWRA